MVGSKVFISRGEDMINNHFADDSILLVSADEDSISATKDCLAMFCEDAGEIFSDHKINY